MSYDFMTKIQYDDALNISVLSMGNDLTTQDTTRLTDYRRKWNFYEGYHWQEIPESEKTEVTKNYCRPFVNKFVNFELGKGFSIKMSPDVEETVLPYLNEVWEDNKKLKICQQFGQAKSVTGDGWLQVLYQPKTLDNGQPNPNFYDPYDEYEKGRVRILAVPPNICFPRYEDGYDKDRMTSFTVMYPIRLNQDDPKSLKTIVYKQVWTNEKVDVFIGTELQDTYVNKYGVIPFFHCKNLELAGRNFGLSDLEDLIPLNMELNLKSSDVSEIIEYHSAPVTLVYGARIGQLEKGANKVWGGLPTSAKVENLGLDSDLQASKDYIQDIKTAMHEIGGVPESALGKEQAISNTSGVALQLMMLPLIERIEQKRALTSECLVNVNKLVIRIGLVEGLIDKDLTKWQNGDKYAKEVYQTEIAYEDNLPKDALVELQQIQLEMKLGLTDREESMKRLGKEDIQQRLKEIDKDRKDHPEIYGLSVDPMTGQLTQSSKSKNLINRETGVNKAGNDSQVNAGFTNSQEKQQTTNS
jgi:hypothetical protein